MPSAESINHIGLISFRVDFMLVKPQEWSDEEQKRIRNVIRLIIATMARLSLEYRSILVRRT